MEPRFEMDKILTQQKVKVSKKKLGHTLTLTWSEKPIKEWFFEYVAITHESHLREESVLLQDK